ncbi:MAG: T9SS type A sorting domain-containing protein [Bacteroidota bacterium]
MEKTLALILAILLYTCSYGQETYYTSGQGSGNWNDPGSWMLDEAGTPANSVPPAEANLVIRHSITQVLTEAYTHSGNIEVRKGSTYEIMGSGDYTFAGNQFELIGNLICALDLRHKSGGEAQSNLIIRNSGLFYALQEMHIEDGSELLSEQGVCGAINIHGALNLHGSNYRMLGQAKIICAELRAYDDLGGEILSGGEMSSYVSRQLGNHIEIFSTESDCEGGSSIVSGKGGHTAKVNVKDFMAIQHEHSVEISWQTESILRFPDLKLERAWAGQSFEAIAEISATELIAKEGHYQAEDDEKRAIDRQYRLIYRNEEGEWVVLGLVDAAFQARMQAYPNPFEGKDLFIQAAGFEADKNLSLKILDLQGRQIWKSERKSDIQGKLAFRASLELQPGSYLLFVESSSVRKSQRLMVR